MKRPIRIAFELLAPPFIGTVLLVMFLIGSTVVKRASVAGIGESLPQILPMTYMILLFAYTFTGIQSILYTVIMEWQFSHGLNAASWRSVGLSSFLGFCSGAVIILVAARGERLAQISEVILLWGGLGLAVGFIMGLLIKAWSHRGKDVGGSSP